MRWHGLVIIMQKYDLFALIQALEWYFLYFCGDRACIWGLKLLYLCPMASPYGVSILQ